MKKFIITSGSVTDAGNLTGYNNAGERIHVFQRQLEAAKVDPKKLNFPMFATGIEKTYDVMDGDIPVLDKEGKPQTFKRLTAGAIFLNKADFVAALTEDTLLEIEVSKSISTAAKEAGLTEKAVSALLEAVV